MLKSSTEGDILKIFKLKDKLKRTIKNTSFFKEKFGFESGIDITNDNQVLYRKNVVIKNIIFVSNLIFTLLFTIISLGDSSNWLLTFLLFPVTFFVNYSLTKFIKKGPDDKMSQTVAMYFASFYMFLISIIIYFKLRNGTQTYLKECGYILIYYSLAITAFYQDKKLLKNVYTWLFIIVTILHFTVTYNIVEMSRSTDIFTFIKTFFVSKEFKDIFMRTILLALFSLVLYIYVTMAIYMQDERKKELNKRRQVQEDFTNVVTKIFDVTLSDSKNFNEEEKKNINIISLMTKKLSSLLSLDPKKCDELVEFSKIHMEKSVSFDNSNITNEDLKFENLRMQTELGSTLISRLQLTRKAEDIVRSVLEGSDTPEFIARQRDILNNIDSQIVLICDIYVTLRSVKSYKKAFNHRNAMNYFETKFKIFFDPVVYDRFYRFNSDFEILYDEN